MSNIQNTIQYLKGNENRYITIVNQENNAQVGKAMIYLADIPNENLESYLQNALGQITKPTLVWVEMRTKNGNSSKKDHTTKIEVSPANYVEPQTQTAAIPQQQAYAPAPAPQQSYLGNPSMGLGVAELVGMHVKGEKLEIVKEQLVELKEDYKQLKHDHRLLESNHRDALTKLSTAEAQKEIAVMLVKSENKSIFDSESFKSLMDKAPEMLGAIAAMKGGGMPMQAALGSPNISETHRQFIDHVAENLNEVQINFLGSVMHYMENENFASELKLLIQKYAHG
ncbi:hypothetical protein [Flavobacterium degerlachei]|jgi:hypothetical protein|uniref:Uncharacterized protein n=1 Tax=Flavobacterium degerlachei TaxID=229203 RepID=A0A1H3B4C3_9FLAO|nr:hypothetical protein [Flavobacterium degerlachei]SDX36645.1 hypothetical protein SAMN05444338_109149 [Flavobacterium degerlachei]